MRTGDDIRWPGAAIFLTVVLCLGGCGSKARIIVVDKLAFGSAPPELHVGDQVVWRNRDIFEHSATADDASFDVDLKPGGDGSAKMTRAGLIKYYCRFHPGMTGVLKVTP